MQYKFLLLQVVPSQEQLKKYIICDEFNFFPIHSHQSWRFRDCGVKLIPAWCHKIRKKDKVRKRGRVNKYLYGKYKEPCLRRGQFNKWKIPVLVRYVHKDWGQLYLKHYFTNLNRENRRSLGTPALSTLSRSQAFRHLKNARNMLSCALTDSWHTCVHCSVRYVYTHTTDGITVLISGTAHLALLYFAPRYATLAI
jgi:hypothetical protein